MENNVFFETVGDGLVLDLDGGSVESHFVLTSLFQLAVGEGNLEFDTGIMIFKINNTGFRSGLGGNGDISRGVEGLIVPTRER